jgi:hypothetical protein
MKKQFCIGNITKVKWHYINQKYGYMAWGHARETFDENSYITTTHEEYNYMIKQFDETMNQDKCYAYIEINKDGKLKIRNLFNSKNEKGFSQKNTFFSDTFYYDLFLDDTSNLLDAYLKLGNETEDNARILHFCVEYEQTMDIDLDFLLYCVELEKINSELHDKLRLIDIQKDMEINKPKKSFFSFFW